MIVDLTVAPLAVELEVGFLASDDAQVSGAGVRGEGALQAAETLGSKVLGDAGAVHLLGGAPLQAVVGLGERGEVTTEALRRGAAQALNLATDLRRASFSLRAPEGAARNANEVLGALAEGVLLAANARTRRPTVTPKEDAAQPPERCSIVLTSLSEDVGREALERARARAEAVCLARELGDAPANRLAPLQLAEQAAAAARAAGLSADVLDCAALESLGAGLLLAVGSGSTRGPALAVLRHRPARRRPPRGGRRQRHHF